ncbi:MAG: hypothetical protein JSS09_02660, partial [Verrucomicrobia bacterium]|nr:hypothetical protein [Verrucomicrobiota bacterium]
TLSPHSKILVAQRYVKTIKQAPLAKELEKTSTRLTLQPILEKKVKEKPPLKEALLQKISEQEKPIKEQPALPFALFSKALQKNFPYFVLKETPPDDKVALAMSNPIYMKALESDVVFFSFGESLESDLFLENLKQAILRYFTSASIFSVTSCKTEEELSLFLKHMQAKLTIAAPTLTEQKLFLPFIKELPASSERFLHKSRLLILEPFAHYFTHPQKKKALWHTLCTHLKNLNTPASS